MYYIEVILTQFRKHMPQARKYQISVKATPYYHCVSRCVRRAFLCGIDRITKKSYQHRKAWVESLILYAGNIFAIDVAAYAVMSNHYHLVLHINQSLAEHLTMYEVISRWHQLFKGNQLSMRYLNGNKLTPTEHLSLISSVNTWRQRLMDISWFMRFINEKIARRANKEDSCTGRFWEGRFKSQALLDEKALISCMAYVDLNPVRAEPTKNIKNARHTSIHTRLNKKTRAREKLMPFLHKSNTHISAVLPFDANDYIDLLRWSENKIKNSNYKKQKQLPVLIKKFNFHPQHWTYLMSHFESKLKTLVGMRINIKQNAKLFKLSRCKGISFCTDVFS